MICDAMLQMYGAANADNYRCISLGLRFVELWHYGLKKPSQDLTWFRRFKSMAEPPLPMSTERQQIASLSILLQISMLGLAFVLGHILRRHKFYYLHEASASLLIGAFFLANLNLSPLRDFWLTSWGDHFINQLSTLRRGFISWMWTSQAWLLASRCNFL